jgi:hypothetical protein
MMNRFRAPWARTRSTTVASDCRRFRFEVKMIGQYNTNSRVTMRLPLPGEPLPSQSRSTDFRPRSRVVLPMSRVVRRGCFHRRRPSCSATRGSGCCPPGSCGPLLAARERIMVRSWCLLCRILLRKMNCGSFAKADNMWAMKDSDLGQEIRRLRPLGQALGLRIAAFTLADPREAAPARNGSVSW